MTSNINIIIIELLFSICLSGYLFDGFSLTVVKLWSQWLEVSESCLILVVYSNPFGPVEHHCEVYMIWRLLHEKPRQE